MPVSTDFIPKFIAAASVVIHDNAKEVTSLDQTIGDGDHVTNLQRGLDSLARLADSLAAMDWSAALQKIGMSLMSSVGGASGSLYGTLFLAMSKAMKDKTLDAATLSEAFEQGVEAMKQRGKAGLGEKTMLDVLIPVADTLKEACSAGLALPQVLENVEKTAAAGVESTRDLVATKGRASFLGDRAKGYLDPGARTAQLMIVAITRILRETPA